MFCFVVPRYKDEYAAANGMEIGQEEMGVIAQELKEVMPDAVKETVSYYSYRTMLHMFCSLLGSLVTTIVSHSQCF